MHNVWFVHWKDCLQAAPACISLLLLLLQCKVALPWQDSKLTIRFNAAQLPVNRCRKHWTAVDSPHGVCELGPYGVVTSAKA